MARSGTYVFNPQLADHIDEAFESCGIDPAELKARHIRSAIRSSNLMLADWQNFGSKQFTLGFQSQSLTAGINTFTLPLGGVDIYHATLKRDSRETEIYAISRSDYNSLHDKTLTGRPDRYFVDRSTFIGDSPASTVYLWQSPENSTDTIEFWYVRKHQDAGAMSNTLDLSSNYQMAFSLGLGYHLSMKFAPGRSKSLRDAYLGRNYDEYRNSSPGGALGRALSEDRDTGDAILRVDFTRGRGRR
jgi:hypothetical protein